MMVPKVYKAKAGIYLQVQTMIQQVSKADSLMMTH